MNDKPFNIDDALNNVLSHREEILNPKNNSVSTEVENKIKLIEYKKEPQKESKSKDETDELKRDDLKLELLISSSGEMEIEDRINQLEELFDKYKDKLEFKERAKTQIEELIEENRGKRTREIYDKVKKDQYSAKIDALEDLLDIFF